MTTLRRDPSEILTELSELRAADAPTHGGRVLSYVYDAGMPELDELASAAAKLVQPVNGLDPTTFTSVAAMESSLIGFARTVLHGGGDVVGSVTSGGTESCLLAVKSARDVWRAGGGTGTPRLVAPTTVHAAFHKAAHYFGVEIDLVSVDPITGAPDAADYAARFGDDVVLVVVSAPSYPFATLDPIQEVAALAEDAGLAVHVDACIGGLALAFWPDSVPLWDFRVPGVTSISADFHKYGYAPKGVSVLMTRGRDRHRAQYFAISSWSGYPVVNPTMTGSKPAGPLASAWAITEALGVEGFRDLVAKTARATRTLRDVVDGIDGLRVVADPTGPQFAVATDTAVAPEQRVDPHLWADVARVSGWHVQQQPASQQPDGTWLPRTAHFTITPVTDAAAPALAQVLVSSADAVRGMPGVDGTELLASLASTLPGGIEALAAASGDLDSESAAELLGAFGLLGGGGGGGALPEQLAPVLALVEALPAPLTERLLIELLARVVEPRDLSGG